jgi:hypothetical protein
MTPLTMFVSEVTADEVAAGFSVRKVRPPNGQLPEAGATALSVIHTWGDPSHRLVKMQGRDGRTVFQLQAFGRPRSGVGPLGWFPERYWPASYGPAWVVDRLREHVGRRGYQALIELHVPTSEENCPTLSDPGADGSEVADDSPLGRDGTDTLDRGPAPTRTDSEPAVHGASAG